MLCFKFVIVTHRLNIHTYIHSYIYIYIHIQSYKLRQLHQHPGPENLLSVRV